MKEEKTTPESARFEKSNESSSPCPGFSLIRTAWRFEVSSLILFNYVYLMVFFYFILFYL